MDRSTSKPQNMDRSTSKPQQRSGGSGNSAIRQLAGTVILIIGLALQISGMMSITWSVRSYDVAIGETYRDVMQSDVIPMWTPGGRTPSQVNSSLIADRSHTFYTYLTPWEYCQDVVHVVNRGGKDQIAMQLGFCVKLYTVSSCEDQYYGLKLCDKFPAVQNLLYVGALFGVVALLTSVNTLITVILTVTPSSERYTKIAGGITGVAGLVGSIFMVVAAGVWGSFHDDWVELERNVHKDRSDSVDFYLGYGFAIVVVGAVLVGGGALLAAAGAMMKVKESPPPSPSPPSSPSSSTPSSATATSV